eukprot:scaffold1982_cov93-Amphora_coffeaeformis.AAC.54
MEGIIIEESIARPGAVKAFLTNSCDGTVYDLPIGRPQRACPLSCVGGRFTGNVAQGIRQGVALVAIGVLHLCRRAQHLVYVNASCVFFAMRDHPKVFESPNGLDVGFLPVVSTLIVPDCRGDAILFK